MFQLTLETFIYSVRFYQPVGKNGVYLWNDFNNIKEIITLKQGAV